MSEVRSPGRASLAGRFLATYAVVFIVIIGLFGLLARNGMESVLRDRAADTLTREARVLQLDLADVPDDRLQEALAARAAALDSRLTVIAGDGTVLADSFSDPATMDDHGSRPEVVAALRREVGIVTRLSDTTDEVRTYVAIPPVDERIYRISVTEEQIQAELADVSAQIGLAALMAGAVGVLVVALVARRLALPIQEVTGIATQMSEGRLDVRARRSSVRELDRLGLSIGRMAQELGTRIVDSEAQRTTLEALLDALPQGVLLVSSDGAILYGNSTAQSILGAVPERLSKLTPHLLQRLVRDAMAADGGIELTLEPAGVGTTLRALASRLPDGRVLLVVSDITERVRVEAMRRDFVADASHELKTPIASILAASETLEMALERDPDRATRFVVLVREAAQQLARIVGDLLDLSRVETSQAGDASVRIDRVVGEEVERLKDAARDRGIGLTAQTFPVTVTGSRSDLALAVRNLVSNAIRYSSEGDRVSVTVIPENGSVRVSVADTGAGIPTRSLPRVFERFYRVDVARSRETGGTGLGLAIVRHVAEAHGGSVSVESELGVGSTFHLVLPTAVEPTSTDEVAADLPS